MKPLPVLASAFLLAGGLLADDSQELVAGEALASRLRSIRPDQAMTNHAVLKIRGTDGRRQVPVTVVTRPVDEAGWEVRYEAAPTGGGTESLSIRHATNAPPRFDARKGTEKVPAQAGFAGSDFAAADLGLEFLHWPRQRLLRRELSNGRMCDVLESRPDGEPPAGYAAVRSWVDTAQGVILSAEAYDARMVRVKQFSVTNFREVGDQWTFSLSIVDDRRGTKTELSYEAAPRP